MPPTTLNSEEPEKLLRGTSSQVELHSCRL